MDACFTVVSADYDVVLYLKDECATNPAVFPRVPRMRRYRCEPPDRLNDRFDYELHAGETYYLVVDMNQPDTFDVLACSLTMAHRAVLHLNAVDTDCLLGQRCTEQPVHYPHRHL